LRADGTEKTLVVGEGQKHFWFLVVVVDIWLLLVKLLGLLLVGMQLDGQCLLDTEYFVQKRKSFDACLLEVLSQSLILSNFRRPFGMSSHPQLCIPTVFFLPKLADETVLIRTAPVILHDRVMSQQHNGRFDALHSSNKLI
jgi:hypothetical protein